MVLGLEQALEAGDTEQSLFLAAIVRHPAEICSGGGSSSSTKPNDEPKARATRTLKNMSAITSEAVSTNNAHARGVIVCVVCVCVSVHGNPKQKGIIISHQNFHDISAAVSPQSVRKQTTVYYLETTGRLTRRATILS